MCAVCVCVCAVSWWIISFGQRIVHNAGYSLCVRHCAACSLCARLCVYADTDIVVFSQFQQCFNDQMVHKSAFSHIVVAKATHVLTSFTLWPHAILLCLHKYTHISAIVSSSSMLCVHVNVESLLCRMKAQIEDGILQTPTNYYHVRPCTGEYGKG